jgi:hypothetical protein
MRIARWALTTVLLTPLVAPAASAQAPDDSLAAAARRAQDQKKSQPKAAKVYDNSNLPTTGPLNVVGQEPATGSSTASTTAPSAPAADAKPAPTAAEIAQMNSDLATAKLRLADLKADLDVAQRKYALDQQTYYGKPNFVADKAGAAALAGEKSDIDAKAEAVALADKLLAEAQTKVDEANHAATAAAAKDADKSAQEKSARDNSSSAAQPAAATPPPPASTITPDSDSTPVNAK